MPNSPFENLPLVATSLPLSTSAVVKHGASGDQEFDHLLLRASQPPRAGELDRRDENALHSAESHSDQLRNDFRTELHTRTNTAHREGTAKRREASVDAPPSNRSANSTTTKKERRTSKATNTTESSDGRPQPLRSNEKRIEEERSDDDAQSPTVCDVRGAADTNSQPSKAVATESKVIAETVAGTTGNEAAELNAVASEATTVQIAVNTEALPAAAEAVNQSVASTGSLESVSTMAEITELLPSAENAVDEVVADLNAKSAESVAEQVGTIDVSAAAEAAASDAQILGSETLKTTGIENVVDTSQPVLATNTTSVGAANSNTGSTRSNDQSSPEPHESNDEAAATFEEIGTGLLENAIGTASAGSNSLPSTNSTNSRNSSAATNPETAQPISAANRSASLDQNSSPTAPGEVAINTSTQVSVNGRSESRATGSATGLSPNTVDPARFIQRVARAFRAVDEQGGQLRLRLSPPELGAIRVEVSVRNGVMTARLEAETPHARSLLLEHLPALRERLAEQQIRIDRFDVDLKQDGNGGGSPNPSPDFGEQRNASRPSHDLRKAGSGSTAEVSLTTAGPVSRTGDGRINVIV